MPLAVAARAQPTPYCVSVSDRNPPRVLADRYELQHALGQGGMGSIWLAHDQMLNRDVAVKLIHLIGPDEESARRRFEREAHAAASLSHQNIVTVHDYGTVDGQAYMVMEHLAGPDLDRLVRHRGKLSIEQTLNAMAQAAAGLSAAHARGILHRDIKPANLMLTSSGMLKILDFGIAAMAEGDENITALGQMVGTVNFLPPERATGLPSTPQSDLYSLGCTGVVLLTGKPLFQGSTAEVLYKQVHVEAPSLRELRPDVPPEVEALFAQLLAKEPAQRPASAQQLAAQLRALRDARPGAGLSAGPSGVASTPPATGVSVPEPLVPQPEAMSGVSFDSSGDYTPRDGLMRENTSETILAPLRSATAVDSAPYPAQGPGGAASGVQTPPPTASTRRRGWIAAAVAVPLLAGGSVLAYGQLHRPSSTAVSTGMPAASAPSASTTASPAYQLVSTIDIGGRPHGADVDPTRNRLYVVDETHNQVVLVDTASDKLINGTIVGKTPIHIVLNPATHMAYITNHRGNNVSVVDTVHNTDTGTIAVGSQPSRVAIDAAANRSVVPNFQSANATIINLTTNTVAATVALGKGPVGVGIDSQNHRAVVANLEANNVSIIDELSGKVLATVPIANSPRGVAVDSARHLAYVTQTASKSVSIISTDSLKVVGMLMVGNNPRGIAVDSSHQRAFVVNENDNAVQVIDLSNNETVSTVPVGKDPIFVTVNPTTGRAYVCNYGSTTVSVIAPS